MTDIIHYKIKTALIKEILAHLTICNNDFIPPLDSKIDLNNYAEKLYSNSVTFEAWDGELLAGLIGAYFNDEKNKAAFITNVSVINNCKGKGIASQLMNMSIDYAKQNNFKSIWLEVSASNNAAVRLYKKFGFKLLEAKNEMEVMKVELS